MVRKLKGLRDVISVGIELARHVYLKSSLEGKTDEWAKEVKEQNKEMW